MKQTNWLPVFFKKAQTTSMNENFIVHCRYFPCCYLFVSLGDCSHMSLSYLSTDEMVQYFYAFRFVGPWVVVS